MMTAEIIPFPKKAVVLTEPEAAPGLPCTTFTAIIPIENIRPFSEINDDDQPDDDE